jgi:membrane fusion protein (multidrug efflux system)
MIITARRRISRNDLKSAFMACQVFALSLLMVVTAGCKKKEKAVSSPPPEVTVMTIAQKDTPVSFDYVAQTESSQLVNIQARVNGFLDKRVYTEGAIVKAGQILFLMDKKPFQAQVSAAAAALDRQKAAMETARLNLERTKPLTAKNALSQKDLDDATGAFEASAAAVNQAKAQLETAELNLSYCTITSPVNGITSAALQQDGSYINVMNSQLTTVAVLSPMWVNFSISEQEIQDYRNQIARKLIIPPPDDNYEVEIILVDGSVFPYRGRITFAAPLYNPQTGTFQLRVTVDNPGGVLRPNQYVRVRLYGAVRPNAVLVPQRAVQQGAKGHFVWVMDKDNKVEPRPVMVGDWYGDDWFISEGLKSGETVVVDGGLILQPGVAVNAKPVAQPAASSSAQTAAAPDGSQTHKSN